LEELKLTCQLVGKSKISTKGTALAVPLSSAGMRALAPEVRFLG
jgi:hypothetical protein